MEKTNYARGYDAGMDPNSPACPFPRANSSWSERLYARGWADGRGALIRQRNDAERENRKALT